MLLCLSRPARALAGLLVSCAPLAALAQARPDSWYVNAEVGGIIPDKPWGARGSAPLFGLDLGRSLSGGWSTELDLTYARLDDRRGSDHSSLEGAALQALRVFDFGARVLPYVSLGAGITHEAPGAGSGLLARTEFMAQPGLGALLGLWDARGAGLALRAEFEARWTHGWAHAPGNPVDPLYSLGLTYYFGGPRTSQP
jgi:Outer membrane protein beta-barrel domain